MSFSNYQGNVYSYDLGLGIEPEIIDYIKESHLIESRISPTKCYLLQQIEHGSNVGSSTSPITISSYSSTFPNYRAVIWSSGSFHPDIRPYTDGGKGSIKVFIDGVEAIRILEVEDLINDNEFAVVERVDLNPPIIELVFNRGFNPTLHTVTYYYTTMNLGINTERMKYGESKESPQSLFGWQQYLDYTDDPFKSHHQILVRTPLTTTNLVINEEGKVELEDNQCWMIWEPYVKNFDILIVPEEESPTGKELRYIIENKQDSKIQGVLVSQRFKIKELELSDERYKIPYITENNIVSFITSNIQTYNVLEKSFSYSNSQLLISNFGKNNINIFKVVLQLNNDFNSGTLYVGSLTLPYLILSPVYNLSASTYSIDTSILLENDVDIYLFIQGTPPVGTGNIIIYYI